MRWPPDAHPPCLAAGSHDDLSGQGKRPKKGNPPHPAALPSEYRPAAVSPLKCVTELVHRYRQERPRLSAATVEKIDAWLASSSASAPFSRAARRAAYRSSATLST